MKFFLDPVSKIDKIRKKKKAKKHTHTTNRQIRATSCKQ